MVCREVEQDELVAKYVSGKLDPAAQDNFEIHILECESCRTSVEILQAVREDVVARAHEIRASSLVPPRRLRWSWVTVPALVVLVMALGPLQLRKLQHTAVLTAKVQPPANTGGPEIIDAQAAKRCAAHPIPQDCFLEQSRTNPPVNGRNYINFKQVEVRPKRTSKDGSKKPSLDIAGQRARSNQINIPDDDSASRGTSAYIEYLPQVAPGGTEHHSRIPAAKAGESIGSQLNQQESVLAILDKLKFPQSLAHDKAFVAELQYLDAPRLSVNDEHLRIADDAILSLASVHAPPYTFSGASAATHSGGTANSVVAGVANSADQPAMARSLFHEAMLAYAEKRYTEAETLLKNAAQSVPGSSEINFYLGICALLGDRANEAIEPLQFVLTRENSPYLQSAHFYLGKAYLQMRDITHAQSELESAAAMPGRLTAEAASTLARLRAVLVFQSEEKPEAIKTPDKKN